VKYIQYRQRQDEEMAKLALFFRNNKNERQDESEQNAAQGPPEKKRRNRKKSVVEYYDDDGKLCSVLPTESPWYIQYVKNPAFGNKFHKKFRRRFRLPYKQYTELVEDARVSGYFDRWLIKDTWNRKSSPLELLILGALRYLGRGWTFDDLEDVTAISEEVHRSFFHVFIDFGNNILFDRYVITPSTADEVLKYLHEYEQAGFHGCVGSTDATHIMMEKCSARLRNAHIGFKMSHTARTYNMTVNHRRRILSTTRGHPARWNDKTLILFDDFSRGIREGRYFKDLEFELLEFDGGDNVVKVKYAGAWQLVDNGYLAWPTTIPPSKVSVNGREIRFSEWLESIRKDVECTFGILKGRWRLLKTGIRLHGVEACDKIWATCCALHNWLLEIDGLDDKWEQGVPSIWEGELGNFEEGDVRNHALPSAIQMLNSPAEFRNFDLSGMGAGDDCDETSSINCEVVDTAPAISGSTESPIASTESSSDEPISVLSLSQNSFKNKLINHFDILFQQNKIVWPSRTGVQTPVWYNECTDT
jgi:hypothetical protein